MTDTGDAGIIAVDTMLPTGEELCSGYLIMPDLVLTARHCAAPVVNPSGPCATTGSTMMTAGGDPLDPSKLFVFTDGTITQTSKTFAVAEVTVLPGSTGQSMCGNDIALLRLAAPLDGVPLIPLRIATSPNAGDMFTAIGYGVSNPTDVSSSGIRRIRADLDVASVGASSRTTDGEWIADTGPCAGDSGSPAIDANGAAFGVMSRGPKATCVSMIYERIDVHADFLVAAAVASAQRLGVATPAWAGGGGGAGGAGGAGSTSGVGGSPPKTPPTDASSGCAVSPTNTVSRNAISLFVMALGVLAYRMKRRPKSPRPF